MGNPMNGNDRGLARKVNYNVISASLENHVASQSISSMRRNASCTETRQIWDGTMGEQLKREREELFGFEQHEDRSTSE